MQRIIGGLLQHIRKTEVAKGSFADLLLSTFKHVTPQQQADKLMLPEAATLFFAGVDTSGHAATWALCVPLSRSIWR